MHRKGSALAAALVITILAAGLVAALAAYSFTHNRTTQTFNAKVYTIKAAEG